MPRVRLRPIWLPIDRAALFVAASMMLSLLLPFGGQARGSVRVPGRGASLPSPASAALPRPPRVRLPRCVCRAHREHFVGGVAVSRLPRSARRAPMSPTIASRCSGVMAPIGARRHRPTPARRSPGCPARRATTPAPRRPPSSVITASMSSLRIGAERLGRGLHRLLVARREGAQRVLHAIAELAQHLVRDIQRVLRDEVDADALGADQPHHLLDLLQQRLRRVVEQQVRLVEEEHQLRLVEIADFRQTARTAPTAARAGTWRKPRRAASACPRPGC